MTLAPDWQATADFVFDWLISLAREGKRCPTTDEMSRALSSRGLCGNVSKQAPTSWLARAGKIRIRVYAKNWRVVEIAAGPFAGLETQGPPNPRWAFYLVMDKAGTRRVET
jgi:hypothetical protein